MGRTAEEPTRAKRGTAQEKILDSAERLFGQFGIDAISLRQISADAGQGNNYAVQYHFGDKDRLISSIVERRMPNINKRRRRLIKEYDGEDYRKDLRYLLKLIYEPLLHETDASGGHAYVKFMVQIINFYHGSQENPWLKAGKSAISLPTKILDSIYGNVSFLPTDVARARVLLVMQMIYTAIATRDGAPANGFPAIPHDALLEDTLNIAVAALTAPGPQS